MIDLKYVTFNREPFFEVAKKLITKNSFVLDIGAGNGHFAAFCERDDFYLFDVNKKSIELLKLKNKNVYQGSLPELPFEEHLFDLVHCSHVIEHLEPQVLYDTLKEIDRCLKPGGYIVVSAPLLWEGFYNDLSHIKPYNPKLFHNYLCPNPSQTRTRSKISSQYSQEKIIYRYKEVELLENISNSSNSRYIKIFNKILQKLRKEGLNRYEKTGYTIVLKKQSSV